MLFPSLRSLNLGFWLDFDESPNAPTFILTHSTILEILDFEYYLVANEKSPHLLFNPFGAFNSLSAESLPLLKEFKGNLKTFRSLVEVRMRSLQHLDSLKLSYFDNELEPLEIVVDRIKHASGSKFPFVALRTMQLELAESDRLESDDEDNPKQYLDNGREKERANALLVFEYFVKSAGEAFKTLFPISRRSRHQ